MKAVKVMVNKGGIGFRPLTRVQNREIESENPYEKVTKMVTKLEAILIR